MRKGSALCTSSQKLGGDHSSLPQPHTTKEKKHCNSRVAPTSQRLPVVHAAPSLLGPVMRQKLPPGDHELWNC